MAQISVMTMVFGDLLQNGTCTDAAMLESLARAGFDGVELTAGRVLESPERRRTYRDCLADTRLAVTCIDAGCNFIADRDAAIAAVRGAVELAVELACPVVLTAGTCLSGAMPPGEGRRLIIEGLRPCVKDATEAGVAVAIENFGVAPTLQCAAGHCAEILDAVPGLVFVFDSGNFYFCGEDPLDNWERLAPRTRHVHIKDWVKSQKPDIADVSGAPLGQGFIPNAKLVRRVLATGVTGSFSIELGVPTGKLDAAAHDLETVRGWIKNMA